MIEPDLLYSVLCDEVRREDNGKWILIGLFEQIGALQYPFFVPSLCVMNKWCNGQGTWTQQTRFVDADDKVLLSSEPINFELPHMEVTVVSVQTFANLRLVSPGKIWVEVLLNGELKQRYALSVELLHPQPTRPRDN